MSLLPENRMLKLGLVLAILLIFGILILYGIDFFSDEGKPWFTVEEVNKSVVSGGNVISLTDTDLKEFPGLEKIIQDKQGKASPWYHDERYLGRIYVSNEELKIIDNKFGQNRSVEVRERKTRRYIEYNGSYYYLDYWLQ